MLRERKLLPKMLKLMATYENLCVHRGKQIHHIFWFKIYFLFCWVFIAAQGLSLVAVSGGLFLVVHGLHIAVISPVAEHRLWACGLQYVYFGGSVIVTHGLQSIGSVAVAHGT